MSGGPGIDAGAVASRCLAAIVDHHKTRGWDLPERRYVAAGNPNEVASDDEHLAVMLDGLTPGATDASQRVGSVQSRGAHAVVIPRATFAIRLMRCIPVDDGYGPPDPDELTASGLELLADVGRVLTSLYEWRRTETGAGRNGAVTFGTVETLGPGGGHAGHLWYLTVSPVQ